MIEKNIIYTPGVLYMQDPDKQGWRMIGEVQDLEIEVENPGPDVLGRTESVKILNPGEMTASFTVDGAVAERLLNELHPLTKFYRDLIRWARQTHPNWLHLAKRAKTARVRVKNMNKILRAYKENKTWTTKT